MDPEGVESSEQGGWGTEQARGAAQRYQEAELLLVKLWTYYYGIGGDIDEVSLDAYLHGALDIPTSQVSLIATAITEMTEDGDPQ